MALATATANHRERKRFLLMALRELVLNGSNQPGLLGPKALLAFMGRCLSRARCRTRRAWWTGTCLSWSSIWRS